MKKLFAVLLALGLLFSVALAEIATESVNWADLEDVAAQLEGDMVVFQDSPYAMWMPADMTAAEVSEEDSAQGVTINLVREDGSYIKIGRLDATQLPMDALIGNLSEQENVSELTKVTVNGFEGITYNITEDGLQKGCAILFLDESIAIGFEGSNIDNDEYKTAYAVLLGSFQAAAE